MKESFGGFLPFEMPTNIKIKSNNVVGLQSARAALKYFINETYIETVWLPAYTCDALFDVFDNTNIIVKVYNITKSFSIEQNIALGKFDVVIYVNYFGLNENNIKNLAHKYPPQNIIIDNSQAYFSRCNEFLASIYSPRKFFGVPDGGLLKTKADLKASIEDSDMNLDKCRHLFERLLDKRDVAYMHYVSAEKKFEDLTPKKISALTEMILDYTDINRVSDIRMRNFNYYNSKLAEYNQLDLSMEYAPLCYPFLPKKNIPKELLVKKNIFLPTYWKDALIRDVNDFESMLINSALFLPLDQRYDFEDLDFVIDTIMKIYCEGEI
ncbi:hypothetical protein [Pantoea sp.]|uniref:hypothetical protein n=1 Tax=Pantoea sp. TaxID=69393 RepID=UPI0028A8AD51|nr:hypothetical protein [Pantoea sp.]